MRVGPLGDGYHAFRVRSVRANGSTDPTPAVRQFSISEKGMFLIAAGDIACAPSDPVTPTLCQMARTADLALDTVPDAVAALGDLQYEDGSLALFQQSYDLSWGRLRGITRPVPGNHEYLTPNAAGYFAYFGAAAGDPSRGYYSYDLGSWHIVALNSACPSVFCTANSEQVRWLRSDLAATTTSCVMAYWHIPLFSSGLQGGNPGVQPLWKALQDARADVILTGHDHHYERFARQRDDGQPDPTGIRQFVLGTGGRGDFKGFRTTAANSEVRLPDMGVTLFHLRPGGYDWTFTDLTGRQADAGSDQCVP